MLLASRPKAQRPFKLRRRRFDVRNLLAAVLIAGLLTASTVVSAGVVRRLPEVWQSIQIRPDAASPSLVSGAPTSPGRSTERDDTAERLAADPINSVDGTPIEPIPPFPFLSFPFLPSADDQAPAADSRTADPIEEADGRDNAQRSHQVVVDSRGRLAGRIVALAATPDVKRPLSGVRINFVRRGRLGATARTGADGRFVVTGLTAGAYALIAAGDDSLLVYGLHVIERNDHAEISDDLLEFVLESSATTGDDVDAVLRLAAAAEATSPPSVGNVDSGGDGVVQPGVPATSLRTHRVQSLPDGRVIGCVRWLDPQSGRPQPAPSTAVTLLREGTVVASTHTNPQGWFELRDVPPGHYGVAAVTVDQPRDEQMAHDGEPTQPVELLGQSAGRRGFATLAVEVVSAVTPLHAEEADVPRPSGPMDVPLAMEFALIDASDLITFTRTVASSRRGVVTGNAARPSGTKTASSSIRPAGRKLTAITTSGGSVGGGVGFPFVPTDHKSQHPLSNSRL